jgi:hypothetical protein
MNKKCRSCGLINFASEPLCHRCSAPFDEENGAAEAPDETSKKLDRAAIWFLKRLGSAVVIAAVILCGIYLSLLQSAEPLSGEQAAEVERAVKVLEERGFDCEVFLLRHTVAFRASDNWLNETTGHENAYAATNFPFQIVTLYESFFTRPIDDTERAMILLHEAQHLMGAGEEAAYEYVWRNKKKLGWTSDKYAGTRVWQNVFDFTRQYAPDLFRCNFNPAGDCTE